MERRSSIDPQIFLLCSVVLLLVYLLSLVLQEPFTFLGSPVVIITGILVVFYRYFSDSTLENKKFWQVSEITFHGAVTAMLIAYAVFIVTGNAIGELLFTLSIVLFCLYLGIPGLVKRFVEQ